MDRTGIINYLIEKNNYKTYLEIGVSDPKLNFNKIKIEDKDGVDPNPRGEEVNYKITSDKFFEKNEKIYDIVFIDGLHLKDQVIKDVKNSLKFLSDNGILVIHDCNPKREPYQTDEIMDKGTLWNGTVWKAIAYFRMTRKDLEMYVVNTDYGCCVLRRGKQELFQFTDNLSWDLLDKNRVSLLNLISIEEFKNIF